jgi:hypothetical protein
LVFEPKAQLKSGTDAIGCMQVQRVGVTALPSLMLTLIVAMGVLALGAHQQQQAAARAVGAAKVGRRIRSTEYTD